jgi:hypothetical protein
VKLARQRIPPELRPKVSFEVAGGADVLGAPGDFDLVFFSWSL